MPVLNKIPDEWLADYTQGGLIPVEYNVVDESVSPSTHYSKALVDKVCAQVRDGAESNYPKMEPVLRRAMEKYLDASKVRLAVVCGSRRPWYEALLLNAGVQEIVVSEYRELTTDDNRLSIVLPQHLGTNRFDFALSISTFEHDGLGRYGDPLNPNGDIEGSDVLARSMTEDGICMLSVPCGLDKLVWNCHRIYGGRRLPELLRSWTILDAFTEAKSETLFVLKKDPQGFQ